MSISFYDWKEAKEYIKEHGGKIKKATSHGHQIWIIDGVQNEIIEPQIEKTLHGTSEFLEEKELTPNKYYHLTEKNLGSYAKLKAQEPIDDIMFYHTQGGSFAPSDGSISEKDFLDQAFGFIEEEYEKRKKMHDSKLALRYYLLYNYFKARVQNNK